MAEVLAIEVSGAETAEMAAFSLADLETSIEAAIKAEGGASSDFENHLKAVRAEAKAAAAELQRAKAAMQARDTKGRFLSASDKALITPPDMKGILDVNAIPQALRESAKGANPFQSLLKGVESVFGTKGADAMMGGARNLVEAGDRLAPIAPALGAAAGGLAAGAAVALAAGVAIGYGAAQLLAAGTKMALIESAQRQRSIGILDKLGKGQGAKDYDVAVKIAADIGADSVEPVLKQYGKLLKAGFDKETIKLVIKASADLGAVEGEEKAKGFLQQLEKAANKGKVNEESLNAMAEAGISVDAVLKKLAKSGESLDAVRARVKSGAVDAKVFAKAAASAVEDQLGGISGKGYLAGLARLKLGFSQLFTGLDMKGPEEALATLNDVIGGGKGAELKAAFTELFGEISKAIFDPFRGTEGKARIENITNGIIGLAKVTASAVRIAAPLIERLITGFSVLAGLDESYPAVRALVGLKNVLVGIVSLDPKQVLAGIAGAFGGLTDLVFGQDLFALGNQMIAGLAQGITSGAGGVIEAIVSTVKAAIGAGKDAAVVQSPSKEFAWQGRMWTEGLAQGANDNADAPARAVTGVVDGSIAAARARGGAGAGGAAGAEGGGAPGLTIIQHFGPGTAPEIAAAAKTGAEAGYEVWRQNARRFARERAA